MITLKAFGTLDLRPDDGRPLQTVLTQRKRLALLAYLAIATPRGFHRRETLLSFLWPELDETRARAGLNRAVHYVRAALGDEVVVSQGQETLGLDWSLIFCDVAAFEAALDRGELAEALALYRGPLLPGFFVDEAPEYDRWLEGERARLQQRAGEAARALSDREEKAGRLVPAIEWARRASALAPHDEACLRGLMLVLEQGGDRAGAIRAYDEFETRIEEDLGAAPASETRALAGAIRAREQPVAAAPPLAPLGIRASPGGLGTGTPEYYLVAHPVPGRHRPARKATTPARIAVAAALLVAAGVVVTTLIMRGSAPRSRRIPVAITEASFSGLNAAVFDRVHRGLADGLDSGSVLHVVGTVLRRPQLVVVGQARVAGPHVSLTAVLEDSAGSPQPLGLAAIDGSIADAEVLGRGLASQLSEIAAFQGPVAALVSADQRDLHAGAATDAYSLGEAAYFDGRYDAAVRDYRHATEIDSSFTLAYLALSMAADWEGQANTASWAIGMAMKHHADLKPLDQWRVRAWDAWIGGRPGEAERLLRLIVANTLDGNAQYHLGEVLFHWGPELGYSRNDALSAFAVLDTLGLPNFFPGLNHRARIAAMDHLPVRVDSLVRRALARHPDSAQTIALRAIGAFGGTSVGEQQNVLNQLSSLADSPAEDLATLIAVCGLDDVRSERAIDVLLEPKRGAPVRADASVLRESFDLAHGRWDAGTSLASAGLIPSGRVAELRAMIAALPFVVVPRATLGAARAALTQTTSGELVGESSSSANAILVLSTRRWYLLGLLSAKLGEFPVAASYADSLVRSPFVSTVEQQTAARLARVVRAGNLRAQGRAAEALAALGGPDVPVNTTLPGLLSYPAAYERFLRAELLHDLHREDEALQWYGAFPDPAGNDLPYVAPALYREAQIAAQEGDPERAATLRARANGLWANAAPEFRAWLAAVHGA